MVVGSGRERVSLQASHYSSHVERRGKWLAGSGKWENQQK